MNRIFISSVFLLVSTLIEISTFADDATVLPQGRFRVRLVSSYTDLDNKYGANGELAGLGSSFSRSLDGHLLYALTQKPELANAVRSLNAVSPGAGDALLGEQIANLNTDIKTNFFVNQFVVEYGLTSRLSVGIIVPLIHADVEVNATSTPDSTFAQKTSAMSDADPRKAIRLSMQNSMTMTSINRLLKDQFQYSNGMNSWSGTGVGDIEIGSKFNYYRDFPLRATLKSGVRLPTGRADDPNNLFDLGFGNETYDLAAYHYVDYDILSNVMLTWEMGYTYQLPNSGGYRIPISTDLPLSTSVAKLDRKLGDYWDAGFEMNVTPIKPLILSAKYHFRQKFQDSYTGSAGVNTATLEADTSQILHEGNFQAEYTNLAAVRAGQDRVPYGVVLFYFLPFAGENVSDSRTAGLQLKTYF
ncbi:MAG: hypothetical protein JWQ35_2040 [Bacteriovoracaceae bacterium]|nr:hypothetical protein [Bacteriovoracaceae bacterium]